MAEIVESEVFMTRVRSGDWPVLDVRSPSEYAHAHIPGAISFPLLNDEQRAEVGTIFKQQGREAAVLRGFELVGKDFSGKLQRAMSSFPDRRILVYCWRGGLRSNIMAFLLQTGGFRVGLLKGGYKSFRKQALLELQKPRTFFVLGGKTGSGKTRVLRSLSKLQEPMLDLELFASHKGSAFGSLGEPEQPSYEQFENLLALSLSGMGNQAVWVENESRMIGRLKVPDPLFESIRNATVFELQVTREKRMQEIRSVYGQFATEDLMFCTEKLCRKLGHLRVQQANAFLQQGDFFGWLDILLDYYDENYQYSQSKRDPQKTFPVPDNFTDSEMLAAELIRLKKRQLGNH